MMISTDLNVILGLVMAMAFVVNIIVQMTKTFMPFPTRIWCIIVSAAVSIASLFALSTADVLELNATSLILAGLGSFIISFKAMYGFDTFKNLWQRFKEGENIDENNK